MADNPELHVRIMPWQLNNLKFKTNRSGGLKMEKVNNILIIPDIHHRTCWKDCIKKIYEVDKDVFLGDYLYPYSFEGNNVMDMDKGFENLKEIVKLKIDEPEKVILLLGNHDFHYINGGINSGRYDKTNGVRNKEFFLDNLDKFDMAYECEIDGKRYFFSHAGIKNEWLNAYYRGIGLSEKPKNILPSADVFNNIIHNVKVENDGRCVKWMDNYHSKKIVVGNDEESDNRYYSFMNTLDVVSYYRGGMDSYGSMIWADVREYITPKNDAKQEFSDTYQIFSHTYMRSPIITPVWACLDVQEGFILDNEGIKDMNELSLDFSTDKVIKVFE